jgi:serine/threonine protein phosphatase PrpC
MQTKEFKIKDTHEFMIMASDGVWDVFSCQEAVNFVRHVLLHNDGNLELAAERLIREAEARDTQDNVSVAVVAFHQVDFSF